MKVFVCVPLLLTSYAWAEEAADRGAIERTIATLNELPRRSAIFTEDASSDLDRLPEVRSPEVRAVGRSAGPTVTISKEPFGEATINFPGVASSPAFETINPRISNGMIRFMTPDVALADGAWTYKDNSGMTQTIPLLLVMKKEGDVWRIASLRLLAPSAHGSTAGAAAP